MSSSIGSVGSSTQQSQALNDWQQRQQGMSTLNAALKSGDIGAARQAYATLRANGNNVNANSPLGKIGAALQSGDIGAAQKAAESVRGHGGGHHHHQAAPAAQPAPVTTTTTSSESPAAPGSVINTTA